MDWVAKELGVKKVFTVELKSVCEDTDVCHWQPNISDARQDVLPEALEILYLVLENKLEL